MIVGVVVGMMRMVVWVQGCCGGGGSDGREAVVMMLMLLMVITRVVVVMVVVGEGDHVCVRAHLWFCTGDRMYEGGERLASKR